MFGKKEEDRITEIEFNRANVYFMSIKTEQGGNTVIPITTNLSESELKTLVEGYISQKGKLSSTDTEFMSYINECGYYYRIPSDRVISGPQVESYEYYIYKK